MGLPRPLWVSCKTLYLHQQSCKVESGCNTAGDGRQVQLGLCSRLVGTPEREYLGAVVMPWLFKLNGTMSSTAFGDSGLRCFVQPCGR
jgi:hypothetical protein